MFWKVRQLSSVLLVILFAVAHRPFQKPAQWKHFTDAVWEWRQLHRMGPFGPAGSSQHHGNPKGLCSTHSGLTITWRGAGSHFLFHCRLEGVLAASGVGWMDLLKAAILWSWVRMGVCISNLEWTVSKPCHQCSGKGSPSWLCKHMR